jgi:hypothetical protein
VVFVSEVSDLLSLLFLMQMNGFAGPEFVETSAVWRNLSTPTYPDLHRSEAAGLAREDCPAQGAVESRTAQKIPPSHPSLL